MMIFTIALSLFLLPNLILSQTTNQHLQCSVGPTAWPKLWLDVVLLIDNSASQTKSNFDAMMSQIQEIWQPGSGGPTVGQGQKQTRVAVVTFDTQAYVVANLNQFNSNADLISKLQAVRQTSAHTVDGLHALQAAGNLLVQGAAGNRPNAPNVIIIYTANWAGRDPCVTAYSVRQDSMVLAILFQNSGAVAPAVPQCVYTPGEIYNGTTVNLNVNTLTSLSYANCFCVGQSNPVKLGEPLSRKGSRDAQVWYQFWLPQADNGYYLRDKWAECVQVPTTASSNHDTAATACHIDGYSLPNEFSYAKHQFLLKMAQQGGLTSQWIGLQYDTSLKQWFWENQKGHVAGRVPMKPGDFTYWNPNQPDITNNQYCVREIPATNGQQGYRWSTAPCTGFQLQYHSQYLCQQPACQTAWPSLWLDVVLLIDNSASQTRSNFDAMMSQIKEIWQPGQGGPTVGQGQKQTRVAVVTFNTQANVVANLNQFHSNADLISNLQAVRQTSASTVDGFHALLAAGNLLVQGAAGNRGNAPNVIIIYTANWAGRDPCVTAYSVRQDSMVLAILFQYPGAGTPTVPQCVYTPGEIYNGTTVNLDVITLTSLSYANCFCVGQSNTVKHGELLSKKGSGDDQVWYQFWLPQSDKQYYLRDKWGECVQVPTTASSNHDTAAAACHIDGYSVPNEFSYAKHQFLIIIAQQSGLTSQWIGLQYDPTLRMWFWDNQRGNTAGRVPMNPGDFTYWNPNQPDLTNNQYCVREIPGTLGASGYRWSTVPCTGFLLQYHSQYLCQKPACDALNFCSNS
uniref:C-type LECtin n=1 Tax=Plectus sambesii TaxID=2011161 RepID=A0A914VHT8_9BILA